MIEVVDGVTDTEAVAETVTAVFRWFTLLPESVEHQRRTLTAHRDWLALVDGRPQGVATCAELPDMKESEAAFAMIGVRVEARGRGVGTALYERASAHARELGKTRLEVFTYADDPDGVGFAERRGFVCVMRNRGLRLVLADVTAPSVEPPEGITIVSLAERRDLDRGMWEVACEAVPDIPFDGDVPLAPGTFDEFRAIDLGGPEFLPEGTFVALAGDEVVGYAQLGWDDRSGGSAYHLMLATRRAWRGRGVASALKAAQIAWAVENGLTELRTANEDRNLAARAVNAKHPYEPMPDGLILSGPLATGAAAPPA